MNIDSGYWSKCCTSCQQSKIFRQTKTPLEHFKCPTGRFDHVHVDIVGPLPPSNGYSYMLTVIDRFTRWPEAYPMVDMSAMTVAKTFYNNYITRFGVPLRLTTDQGTQFEAKLFNGLIQFLGIHRIRTSPYHPQANGMVEILHRRIKESLKSRGKTNNWSDELPTVLLGIRTTVKEHLKCSPAEIVYGQTLRIPGEIFVPTDSTTPEPIDLVGQLKETMRAVNPVPPKLPKTKIYVPSSLDINDYVFVRVDKVRIGLTQLYDGPYKVIRRLRKQFIIEKNEKSCTLSIDRPRPAFIEDDLDTNTKNKKVKFKIKYFLLIFFSFLLQFNM